jgi:hypothetical protein
MKVIVLSASSESNEKQEKWRTPRSFVYDVIYVLLFLPPEIFRYVFPRRATNYSTAEF